MRRWLALIAAVVGGAIAAFAAAVTFVGVIYGFLWIYVLGDSSWPIWVDPVMNMALVLFSLAVWVVTARLIWKWLRTYPTTG